MPQHETRDGEHSPTAVNEQVFRRLLATVTLAYWLLIYAVLTLRSFVVGNPRLDVQALLRIPMVLLGLALCAAIYLVLRRVDERSLRVRIAVAATSVALATEIFGAAAYYFYYVAVDLWPPTRSFAFSIGYYTFQFLWIFPLWLGLLFYLRHRFEAAGRSKESDYDTEFWPKHLDRRVRVAAEDILWIEAEGDYVRLHLADQSYLLRSTMRSIARRLDPETFVRIHRRYIVARMAIGSASRRPDGRLMVQLLSGPNLPAGRSYLGKIAS